MNRRKLVAVAATFASAVWVSTLVGVAQADPATSTTLTYHFTQCSGPAGTPSTFDAVKQPSEAAALQLTSGDANFVLMEAVDVVTGATLFATPGFTHNNLPTVTCNLIHPVTGQQVLVTGLITPVG